ncbi:MAG: glutamate synthase large subunit [Peptococcaceae bacterium]|nr:glutamate synthase large subunit [Peptococcaceae bacterium]
MRQDNPIAPPLYCPQLEHDACGVGAVVDLTGKQTHETISDALSIVEKLRHRAGRDANGETGDGVGILLQIPHRLFSSLAADLDISLGGPRQYAVGMFFFPADRLTRLRHRRLFEVILEKYELELLFWRAVPTHPEILSAAARDCMPAISQCVIKRPPDIGKDVDFDRLLYIVRREFEQSVEDTYVASLSCRTIVYKGMFLVEQLRAFYADLADERAESALAMVHSRFSTNTQPSWERAHPNRLLLHNGEINTIRGNIDRMLAREETMHSEIFADNLEQVLPVINSAGSDSAMLDNVLEFLMFAGIELPRAVMITVPEPWQRRRDMSRARRDMYHYYATMMEPWDGPAALLFSDGDQVGAALDRNGLRPLRYYQTEDRLIIASEVGVLDIAPETVLKKSRIRPGKMLLADVRDGTIREDSVIKDAYAAANPYGEWLDRGLVTLQDLPTVKRRVDPYDQEMRDRLYKAFGYTYEDIHTTILPMAKSGVEPTVSMGLDIPLPVLSEAPQPLFNYFRQMFAQVTNPPIDAIREEIVIDTTMYVGTDGNLLQDSADNCRMLQLEGPLLTSMALQKIKSLDMPGLKSAEISLLYYCNASLEHALDQLFVSCDKAYHKGANIIILSDRGVDENHMAIPSLLAVSALQHYLVRTRKSTAISIILESAEPRTVHHCATLLGYGATAIHPYLAHECIAELAEKGLLTNDYYDAVASYNEAIENGVVEIAAKMGISTLQSYLGAQIFEAVGIAQDVIDRYFTNTISRIGGIGLAEIAATAEWYHDRGFDPVGLAVDPTIESKGSHCARSGAHTEDHLWDAETIRTLQRAVREDSYDLFKEYAVLSDHMKAPHTLRRLLDFDLSGVTPVPLEEVEPEEDIVKRFKTGAMSLGSISPEAHACLAIAMNRLGGKSNSGEGGELPERLHSEANSAIKQVASGRFGVTSAYLVSAKEIQIKLAQGAKPGEGGHLPGKKVWPHIARTRFATPGVSLISPPPHHDIYSIEDLAQLIYDLKNANTDAAISVKLASEAGVGTIAAGVAKAGAEIVLISGADGGTGAAPQNSVYNAGLPWELGLAEAHQTLLASNLRHCVRLETDGKLMNGTDVAFACILGAEEFGFATAPLIALGCKMMRLCNKDNCPMGIATQDPELRKHFAGKPEYVERLMRFIARQLREQMATLGVRCVDELVGRVDLLKTRSLPGRAEKVDVRSLLADADGPCCFDPGATFSFELEDTIDEQVLLPSLDGAPLPEAIPLSCTDRAFGTRFGSALTRRYGDALADDAYTIQCTGSAGQSFGAFIPKGLTLRLEGDSNDYLGKGLSGGKLIIYPSRRAKTAAEEQIIIGNVALYGATSGEAFINGIAGERFCVRNSGATAVVEGVGAHGCEYMTGGRVLVLGPTGRNFAAGMSGGVVYLLDSNHDLYLRVNKALIDLSPVTESHDIADIRELLEAHASATGSPKARRILAAFEDYLPLFKKIVPRDNQLMAEDIARLEARGMTRDEAELTAFLERRAQS